MNGQVAERPESSSSRRPPGAGRRVSIIGVPCGFGAGIAHLRQRIAQLGYEVRDLGDLRLDCPPDLPPTHEKVKYLGEHIAANKLLAADVKKVLEGGELPVILGGDHSIAIGS